MRTNNSKGFTLLEILISVSILAVMAVFLAQTTQRALRNRVKIQKGIDKVASVRDALNIMSRDIQYAFNYRDINIELYNEAQKERVERKKKKTGTGKTTPGGNPPPGSTPPPPTNPKTPQPAFTPKEEKIVTFFQGDNKSINLTTLSNIRSKKNEQSSRQAEVGYYLEDCKSFFNKKNRSKCLWRRISHVIDDKVDEGGKNMVLLENVTQFKLRYLAPTNSNEPEWRADWKSGEGSDDFTKNKFPSAVEITIEIQDQNVEKDKKLIMTKVAQIRFPNNQEKSIKDPNSGK